MASSKRMIRPHAIPESVLLSPTVTQLPGPTAAVVELCAAGPAIAEPDGIGPAPASLPFQSDQVGRGCGARCEVAAGRVKAT